MYEGGLDSNDITFIGLPYSIEIRVAVLEFKHADGQTRSVLRVFILCTSCTEQTRPHRVQDITYRYPLTYSMILFLTSVYHTHA
jgi:hypothetical protein